MAADNNLWAVRNLCRLRKVTGEEALVLHDRLNVAEWAELFMDYNLAEELHYYFPVSFVNNENS